MTVTRWCESGKLPAIAKPYGKKVTWLISPQAVELLVMQEAAKAKTCKAKEIGRKAHNEYQIPWHRALAKGTLNGKVYSQRTIDDYSHYIALYFAKYPMLSAENLKKELMAIPAVHFSKREHFYKAVLCFSRFLILENLLDKSFLDEIEPLYPKRHLPPKRLAVDESGIQSLLASCDTLQERLIILLLAYTGLRASEACALTWNDINFEAGCLIVRLGKGNKSRPVGLTGRLIEALSLHKAELRHSSAHVLINREGQAMDRSGLYQRVERIGGKAGVKVSPHALRRAFVTINANKGRPLVILQRSCGHSDIKTTMSYCLTSEQEVIEAMKGWD